MASEGGSGKIVVPVRLIRSFLYRNIQHIVMRDVSPSLLGKDFLQLVLKEIQTSSGLPPPFRSFGFDTLKVEHRAHGAKTNDPVINTEQDEVLILDPERTLRECGVENETELSLFKMEDYVQYKERKEVKW